MIQRSDFGGFGDVALAFNDGQNIGPYHSSWIFDWLKKLVGPAYGAHVLDLGCGTGTITRYLAEAGFQSVVGVDPDPRMIAVAKRVSLYPLCVCAPTNALPFPDAGLDAVFVHYAFEHFCHDAASIMEVRRVLRDGGILMTVTWPVTGWNKTRNEVIQPFALDDRTPPPYQHLAETGYADLLGDYGFKKVETRRQKTTIYYTMDQARRYMLGSSLLSCVPPERFLEAYRALDKLSAQIADARGIVTRELDVIVDIGRR